VSFSSGFSRGRNRSTTCGDWNASETEFTNTQVLTIQSVQWLKKQVYFVFDYKKIISNTISGRYHVNLASCGVSHWPKHEGWITTLEVLF
jgi:hypothetical protein